MTIKSGTVVKRPLPKLRGDVEVVWFRAATEVVGRVLSGYTQIGGSLHLLTEWMRGMRERGVRVVSGFWYEQLEEPWCRYSEVARSIGIKAWLHFGAFMLLFLLDSQEEMLFRKVDMVISNRNLS